MFRYSKLEYSNLLLNMGVVRVGTLYDFRRDEHKVGIADVNEGKKVVHHLVESLSGGAQANAEMLRHWGVNIVPNSNIQISNVAFQKNVEAPNHFILCFSKKLSRLTMQEFEGANSCIEIINEHEFFFELTRSLNAITPVHFLGVHEVQYRPRVELWNGANFGIDPSLIKEDRFSSQHELRALWKPKYGQSILPTLTGFYRLGQFCKLHLL